MIKINAKSSLLKTLILVMVSALMLSTSTYAWFSTGAVASVGRITASFAGEAEISTLEVEEAIDADYSGIREPEEEYAPLADDSISITMQPGKMNFYKMGVHTPSGTSSLLMKGITVTSDGTLSNQEILENITIAIQVQEGSKVTKTLWEAITDLHGANPTAPYSITLASNITDANIYVDLGIAGATSALHNTAGFQSALVTCSFALQTQSAT